MQLRTILYPSMCRLKNNHNNISNCFNSVILNLLPYNIFSVVLDRPLIKLMIIIKILNTNSLNKTILKSKGIKAREKSARHSTH